MSRIAELAAFARLSDLPHFAARAAGSAGLSRADFLPQLAEAERESLRQAARAIRQPERPAIFIHGVLPRSGTNYLSDLLALHPDALQNPGRLWEFPLLRCAKGAQTLQSEFGFFFPPNREVMPEGLMLTLLAQGWLKRLEAEAPGRSLLLKSPHMQAIGLFDAVFPDDRLFLLIRDGRDVVASSLASFTGRGLLRKPMRALAQEWALATRSALETAARLKGQACLVRYEDIAAAPACEMERLLRHAGLDPARYPWERMGSLPLRGSSENLDWQGTEKPEGFRPVGRWQAWPKRLRGKFRAIAGEALAAAGYEASARW